MMADKQNILHMLGNQAENVSYDHVLYQLDLWLSIEIGMDQIKRGQGIDHDDLFNQLEAEHAQEKAGVVSEGQARSRGNKGIHRETIAKDRRPVRPPARKPRESAADIP